LEGDEYWYADDDVETVIGVDNETTPIFEIQNYIQENDPR